MITKEMRTRVEKEKTINETLRKRAWLFANVDRMEITKKFMHFREYLRSAYGSKVRDYRTWSILERGVDDNTPPPASFDFEGADSVIKFIESEHHGYVMRNIGSDIGSGC